MSGSIYWDDLYSKENVFLNDYDGWLDPFRVAIGGNVLDLGCGAGTNIPILLSCGAAVTAADFSINAVQEVRERFKEQLAGADCFDMREGFPYADGSFDLVVADLSLHYFTWEDTRSIIAEIRRILHSGGRLFARVHSEDNIPDSGAVKIDHGYYMAYGFPRRYFTLADVQTLFSDWSVDAIPAVANRYGRQKKIIRICAERR